MHQTLRQSVAAVGLTAALTAGLGTALASSAAASSDQALALTCQRHIQKQISTGHVLLFGVSCKGNSSSPYWAAGYCSAAGPVKGPTQFPPFLTGGYGPWSNISCPSGSYLTTYEEVHG